jgi:hypothetical protein
LLEKMSDDAQQARRKGEEGKMKQSRFTRSD